MAAGIAGHLGVPPVAVRVAFVALVAVNGLGLVLYGVYWALLPADGEPQADRRLGARLLPYLVAAAGVLVLRLVDQMTGVDLLAAALFAVVVGGAGVIWHQSDEQQRRRWLAPPPGRAWLGAMVDRTDRRLVALRYAGGALLLLGGLVGMVAVYSPVGRFDVLTVLSGIMFAVVVIAGLALVAAPVLWRIVAQLRAEQEARIREQERAEVAAMVHDQVLHTLALILRNAADARAVQRLARAQERALRGWLYRPAGSPADRLSAALEVAAAQVEDEYGITVETVVVGDAPVDEHAAALVAATREALVNAARHAGTPSVSLYAEVEPDQVAVFVRDRGVGFAVADVPPDRHGLSGSVVGRMRRHGGSAEIRAEPGAGTEIRLRLPRPAAPQPARSEEEP